MSLRNGIKRRKYTYHRRKTAAGGMRNAPTDRMWWESKKLINSFSPGGTSNGTKSKANSFSGSYGESRGGVRQIKSAIGYDNTGDKMRERKMINHSHMHLPSAGRRGHGRGQLRVTPKRMLQIGKTVVRKWQIRTDTPVPQVRSTKRPVSFTKAR